MCVKGTPRTCRAACIEWENMPSFVALTVQRDAVRYGARWRCLRSIATPESVSRAMYMKACVIASPHDKVQCVPSRRILLACTTEVSSRISAEASLEALKQLGNCFSICSIQAEFSGRNITRKGTAVAQWLRCCATNRKVAGSVPDGVIGIFH